MEQHCHCFLRSCRRPLRPRLRLERHRPPTGERYRYGLHLEKCSRSTSACALRLRKSVTTYMSSMRITLLAGQTRNSFESLASSILLVSQVGGSETNGSPSLRRIDNIDIETKLARERRGQCGLARSRFAVEQIASTVRNTSRTVPVDLLVAQELLHIRQETLFEPWGKDDTGPRTAGTRYGWLPGGFDATAMSTSSTSFKVGSLTWHGR